MQYQPDALQAISEEEAEAMVTQFPLLQAGAEMLGDADTPSPSLESLLGGEAKPEEGNPEQ